MKAISLLVNSYLPPELRNYSETYDVKSMNRIMRAVAEKHPEQFAEVMKKISDLGRTASYVQGETITLKDLEPVIDKESAMAQMQQEIAALPKDTSFTRRRREIFQKYTDLIEKATADKALKNRNNIALAVMSGARGKMPQLRAMISPVGTFSDYKGEVIDVYSKESFADGIRPTTFLASTYGARSSVISTKCLSQSTLVRMADLSVKEIKDIQVGDMVLGADKTGHVFPVRVLNVFDQGEKECYEYKLQHGDEKYGLTCTKDHKVLTERNEIKPFLELSEKDNLFGGYRLTGKTCAGKVHCFDIEVDHPDHLFVLANGIITSNSSTAKGGDLAKQFASIAGDMVIRKNDCGTDNGIPLSPDDPSLKGRVLAQDIGNFKAGTVITREMMASLEKAGAKYILARSPLTCSCPNGLCAKCVGKLYKGGKMPKIGDAVGLSASTTSMEPVTQMALSAKHTAGMTQGKKSYSGLAVIQQFTQSPEKFKDIGVVSEVDGKVDGIEEAPQGGTYVTVSGERHYIPAGHEVQVQQGQTVEAGDQLAEGLVDAEDIVRLKGLGAGRKYYAERLNKILEDSGAKTDKRNTEILARAAIRHVRVNGNDGIGNYLPDDIVDYEALEGSYIPRESTKKRAKEAIGSYLTKPRMHYTIGTRVTPSVAKDLEEHNYGEVEVSPYEPGFTPEMIRLRTASHANQDWLASLTTSYLTQQINESSTRGDDTNVLRNTDYRPRIMYGAGFGKNVDEKGEF